MDADRIKSWPTRALSVVSVALPLLAFSLMLYRRVQDGERVNFSVDYASLSLQDTLVRLLPTMLFGLGLLAILLLILSAARNNFV